MPSQVIDAGHKASLSHEAIAAAASYAVSLRMWHARVL